MYCLFSIVTAVYFLGYSIPTWPQMKILFKKYDVKRKWSVQTGSCYDSGTMSRLHTYIVILEVNIPEKKVLAASLLIWFQNPVPLIPWINYPSILTWKSSFELQQRVKKINSQDRSCEDSKLGWNLVFLVESDQYM